MVAVVLLVGKAVHGCWLTAKHTGWGKLAALAEQEHVGVFFQQLDLVNCAETATMLARTATVRT